MLGVGVQLPAGYFLSLLLYSLLVGVAAVAIVLDLGLGVVIEGAGGFSFQSFSVFFHDYYYKWSYSSKSIGGKYHMNGWPQKGVFRVRGGGGDI